MTVFQNDLDPTFNHVACYYTSIAAARKNHEWTARELSDIFLLCKKLRYIDEKNCIYSPLGVAKTLETGLTFVGKKYLDYKPIDADYVIGCWKKTKDAVDAHFVVMDNSGIYTKDHVSFDPWKGGSQTVANGLCTSLRIYRRIM